MSDQREIKSVSVRCANPIAGEPIRGFILSATEPCADSPWPQCLDDDAELVFQALTHGLPQGTIDRLTARLMKRISSDLLISFEAMKRQSEVRRGNH